MFSGVIASLSGSSGCGGMERTDPVLLICFEFTGFDPVRFNEVLDVCTSSTFSSTLDRRVARAGTPTDDEEGGSTHSDVWELLADLLLGVVVPRACS